MHCSRQVEALQKRPVAKTVAIFAKEGSCQSACCSGKGRAKGRVGPPTPFSRLLPVRVVCVCVEGFAWICLSSGC